MSDAFHNLLSTTVNQALYNYVEQLRWYAVQEESGIGLCDTATIMGLDNARMFVMEASSSNPFNLDGKHMPTSHDSKSSPRWQLDFFGKQG